MNPLDPKVVTGTTGELLVQLRLFQYDVQAAPPIKDSGNDLIAVRGTTLKAVQVKTTGNADGTWQLPSDRLYHVLALVRLHGEDCQLALDESEVYLLDCALVDDGLDLNDLDEHRISQETVDRLFSELE